MKLLKNFAWIWGASFALLASCFFPAKSQTIPGISLSIISSNANSGPCLGSIGVGFVDPYYGYIQGSTGTYSGTCASRYNLVQFVYATDASVCGISSIAPIPSLTWNGNTYTITTFNEGVYINDGSCLGGPYPTTGSFTFSIP